MLPNAPAPSASPQIAIGERIQKLLGDLNQTPAWLAERVGVSRSTITRILKAERNPVAETLQDIAPVLGVTLAQLVLGTDAAERVKASDQFVARSDYDSAVRQVIEFEGQVRLLTSRLRDLSTEVEIEKGRAREVVTRAERDIARAEHEREQAIQKCSQLETEVRRYRAALKKAVGDVAQLHAQVRELGAAVEASRSTGRVAAILAGVAAAVSVATYLNSTDSEDYLSNSSTNKTKKERSQ